MTVFQSYGDITCFEVLPGLDVLVSSLPLWQSYTELVFFLIVQSLARFAYQLSSIQSHPKQGGHTCLSGALCKWGLL